MGDQSAIEQHKRAKKDHDTLTFLGLRAQATAAGLIQLCAELRRVGAIDEAAIDRIKSAVVDDLAVSLPAFRRGSDAQRALRQRIDAVFASRMGEGAAAMAVGDTDAFRSSLGIASEDVERG